ncbi:MAG: translation initiation factor IF-2 subunit beta [Nanoarchaeota archaeon]|nr:translation initiation factor IF-2 subunit beta [Nanoarchaeota archaeon]|tara:strand:+ start:2460 stop:2867 length:408 start_codon:yes stop_codon:yes gene_type:complete
MDYEELLDKGLKELPEDASKGERFEIPKVKGHIEGNKTIIVNFVQIANDLRREVEHLLKFLLRELAAPGNLDDKRLILGRKISAGQINEKIELYAKTFVLCKECGKPDTQIVKEGKINMLRCTACGARHNIKTKI